MSTLLKTTGVEICPNETMPVSFAFKCLACGAKCWGRAKAIEELVDVTIECFKCKHINDVRPHPGR